MMKYFLALLLITPAFAQSSPMLSFAAEAYVTECPSQLKYTSADVHKKNVADYKKQFGAAMYADLLKGSREKVKEKGGCKALIPDLKAKGAATTTPLNVTLK